VLVKNYHLNLIVADGVILYHSQVLTYTRHVIFNKANTSRVSDISVPSEAIDDVNVKMDTIFTDNGYDSKSSHKLTHSATKSLFLQEVIRLQTNIPTKGMKPLTASVNTTNQDGNENVITIKEL
jgi:hypothetical protein